MWPSPRGGEILDFNHSNGKKNGLELLIGKYLYIDVSYDPTFFFHQRKELIQAHILNTLNAWHYDESNSCNSNDFCLIFDSGKNWNLVFSMTKSFYPSKVFYPPFAPMNPYMVSNVAKLIIDDPASETGGKKLLGGVKTWNSKFTFFAFSWIKNHLFMFKTH